MKKIHVWEDDKHLQIDELDLDETKAWEIWNDTKTKYPNFVVDFCFHNTLAPINFLKQIGAEVLDDCIEMRLTKEDFIDLPVKRVIEISDFEDIAALHDKSNTISSNFIRKTREQWDFFGLYENGNLIGYSGLRSGWEIYFIISKTNTIEDITSLASAAIKKAFEKNPEASVLYQADRNEFLHLGAALHLGFNRKGFYIGYRTKS